MSKLYELITPKSENREELEQYEYLMCWYGRDMSIYQYMFYDPLIDIKISSQIFNPDNNIRTVINAVENYLTINIQDVERDDFKFFSELAQSVNIFRLFKDGTQEKYASLPSSFKYTLLEGRYELKFKLRKKNDKK